MKSKVITVFEVVDSPFNRTNAPNIIGLFFIEPPSYVEVKKVLRNSNLKTYESYLEFRLKNK